MLSCHHSLWGAVGQKPFSQRWESVYGKSVGELGWYACIDRMKLLIVFFLHSCNIVCHSTLFIKHCMYTTGSYIHNYVCYPMLFFMIFTFPSTLIYTFLVCHPPVPYTLGMSGYRTLYNFSTSLYLILQVICSIKLTLRVMNVYVLPNLFIYQYLWCL